MENINRSQLAAPDFPDINNFRQSGTALHRLRMNELLVRHFDDAGIYYKGDSVLRNPITTVLTAMNRYHRAVMLCIDPDFQ